MNIIDLFETNNNITNFIIEDILNNCQPFLQKINYDISNYKLYRGINIPNPKSQANLKSPNHKIAIVHGNNPNRRPADTPVIIHNQANIIFTRLFGYPFRNSLFTTSDEHVASFYGPLHQVIPMNEFHFLWSKNVKDMYDILSSFEHDHHGETKESIFDKFVDALNTNAFHYQTDDLLEAIKSGNEIMLYCDKCMLLPVKDLNVVAALNQISSK